MELLTIQVPESWREFLAEQVAKGGHRSADDYVEALLREAEVREGQAASQEFVRNLTPDQNARLEELIQEGLDSGEPVVADEAFWEQLRGRIAGRFGKESVA